MLFSTVLTDSPSLPGNPVTGVARSAGSPLIRRSSVRGLLLVLCRPAVGTDLGGVRPALVCPDLDLPRLALCCDRDGQGQDAAVVGGVQLGRIEVVAEEELSAQFSVRPLVDEQFVTLL